MTTHTIYGYTYWASIYCKECGDNLPDIDPEGNDKHPFFSWDEIGGSCDTCLVHVGQDLDTL
jgi:hypothetical protein